MVTIQSIHLIYKGQTKNLFVPLKYKQEVEKVVADEISASRVRETSSVDLFFNFFLRFPKGKKIALILKKNLIEFAILHF